MYSPPSLRYKIRNPEDLIGIQLFDLWTCNRDTRQFIYWKNSRDKKYTVTFIDNGHCFGGPDWKFAPMVFTCGLNDPSTVGAWAHWADRVANFSIDTFEGIEAGSIPAEWFGEDKHIAGLVEELKFRQRVLLRHFDSGHRVRRIFVVDDKPRIVDTLA